MRFGPNDEENPFVDNDKAPPSKTADEYAKEEIKSARNGIGGLLMLGFVLGRSIQVLSRKPGTNGPLVTMAWPAAVVAQVAYLYGHQEKYGVIDATPFAWLFLVQGSAWFLGIVVAIPRFLRPQAIPELALGTPILARFMPNASQAISGVVSDAAVGSVMIAVLLAIGSPVQASVMQVTLGLLMLCHAGQWMHGAVYRGRTRRAQRRAATWRQDVRGGHSL